ncbi:MAG: uroporphyrinogen decarboxylase family protein [Fimbriimonadales bacterium]
MSQAPNKRELMLGLLQPGFVPPYVPAAFFLHFPPAFHRGRAAVDKHLEFFRATGMDLVKIQFEMPWPDLGIREARQWAEVPKLGMDFYRPMLEVVEGLVREAGSEAVVVLTLYSPYMIAAHLVRDGRLDADLQEAPEAVAAGLQRIADDVLEFVRECRKVGLDGFYHSTQGGEERRFPDSSLFEQVIRPSDLKVMREIAELFPFNILHVCDYHRAKVGGYASMEPFLDYPGHVLSCSPHIGGEEVPLSTLYHQFGRPVLGGMDRLGVIASGSEEEVRKEARRVLDGAFPGMILGADCTVPADTPWSNLAAAIDEAHRRTF